MNFSSKKLIMSKEFYDKIGSNRLLDSLYIFLLTPTALIGLILNLIGFYVFCKLKTRQTKLYIYLRLYTFNSATMSLLCCFAFTTLSPSYFPYFSSTFSKIYRCILLVSPFTTLYFIGNMLDLVIALDRLSIFIKKLRIVTQHSPYKISSSIIIGCVLINSPVYFLFYAKSDEEFYYGVNYNINQFTYCGRTSFYKSKIGYLITLTLITFRDLMTVLVETIIIIWAIYHYRNFSIRRKNDALFNNKKRRESIVSIKREERFKQLLLMTIYLCILTIITHIIIYISFLLSLYDSQSSKLYNALFTSTLSLCIKYISNFVVFYHLNSNFKTFLLKNFL
jgi:hypothetical protein